MKHRQFSAIAALLMLAAVVTYDQSNAPAERFTANAV